MSILLELMASFILGSVINKLLYFRIY